MAYVYLLQNTVLTGYLLDKMHLIFIYEMQLVHHKRAPCNIMQMLAC